ncbi:Mitochondrial distribution and morphology protein 12 [Mortierella sp. AM989]|nr:Mitochondrial distribution and morphology protein 12 [Mortierella sp. AM989]
MSFIFSWEKLDDEVALQIEGMIHAHFQRITKPSFMGNIAVSKFRFGSTPPNITVLDVTDPLEEWYVHMDQEEARLAQEAAEAGGGESLDEDELESGDEGEYEDEYSYSDDGSVVMVGEGDDIEYLGPESFEERERLEAEEWMHRQQRSQRNDGSSSSDSFKEELQFKKHLAGPRSRSRESASEQDVVAPTEDHHRHFRSATTSPTKFAPHSPSSSTSSVNSFGKSTSPMSRQKVKQNSHNLKLEIDKSHSTPSQGFSVSTSNLPDNSSPRKSGTTLSLSSHASDDEIESEAFYTQGESTIFQRMKNLVLEPSIPTSSRPASADGNSPRVYYSDQPQLAASALPSTSASGGGATLGFGLGAGIGSPGTVLSTVMQNRTTTRPLSVASFYSSPSSANASSSGQLGQMSFPDLSNMVVSGNSLLGLRAGTASRTIPSTPRGFESPTLAFSRRQSFSEPGSDDHHANVTTADRSGAMLSELQNREREALQSGFMSPVEALSFEAFSHQPKVVERLKDPEDTTGGSGSRNGSQSGRSHHEDRRSRSSSMRHDSERRPMRPNHRGVGNAERGRKRKKQRDPRSRYEQEDPTISAPYPSPPPIPPKRHENDIQLLLSVNYQGQMGFTVETEMLLNYPTFAFLALPVKLVITGFSFKAKVLMGYLRDHVNVCFLEPEDPAESILSNVRIESQVGDEQKHAVLKNVGKIERFVVEQLRKFITEDFVYPSYHSIELLRAPPPSPPSPPPSAQPRNRLSEPNASSRGASTSHSSTAASITAPASIDTPSSSSSIRAQSYAVPSGSSRRY